LVNYYHWQSSVEEFDKLCAEIFPEDGSEPSEPSEPEPEELLICSQCQNQFNPDDCDFDQGGDGEHPLCQTCWDNDYCWCERCYVVMDFSQEGFWCHSCDFKHCDDCLGTEIQNDYYCEGCYDGVEYFYCEGCGENYYHSQIGYVQIEADDYCQHCLGSDEMAYIQCSICEENIFDSSKNDCWLCGCFHCNDCKNETFPELCVKCDREASSDEDETIEITSQYKVTKQASDNCWICQKKIWRLKNDPRRMSAGEFINRVGAHYNIPRWQTTQAQRDEYCAMNNIVDSRRVAFQYFDMSIDVELPFLEVDNTVKTMINACNCGPCHVVCLYKLRRADPDKFEPSKCNGQNNKKLLYRQCITCGTKWKNELYMMFCDNEEFNSDMDEEDKHNARATLAVVQADNVAAAHQWSEFARQDEKLKGSYALVPSGNFGMRLRGKMLPWFMPAKINAFLEPPPPQPTAARLLKDDRRVVNVKERFGRDALPFIYHADGFLSNSIGQFIPDFGEDLIRTPNIDGPQGVRWLMRLLHQPNKDYFLSIIIQGLEELDEEFDESLPLCALATHNNYDRWKLMKQHYNLVGFFESLEGELGNTNINYTQLVNRLTCFKRSNQGESKSST